jgi:hypothetical protein
MFAGAYERLAPWLEAGAAPQWLTVPEMLNLPGWIVVLALVGVAAAVEWVLSRQKANAV